MADSLVIQLRINPQTHARLYAWLDSVEPGHRSKMLREALDYALTHECKGFSAPPQEVNLRGIEDRLENIERILQGSERVIQVPQWYPEEPEEPMSAAEAASLHYNQLNGMFGSSEW